MRGVELVDLYRWLEDRDTPENERLDSCAERLRAFPSQNVAGANTCAAAIRGIATAFSRGFASHSLTVLNLSLA
jgi:hypothetical protein